VGAAFNEELPRARVYYDQLRMGGKRHHAALRALAFKWQRILFRCWKDGVTYDESKYIASLKKRNSPSVCGFPNEDVQKMGKP